MLVLSAFQSLGRYFYNVISTPNLGPVLRVEMYLVKASDASYKDAMYIEQC